MRIYPRSDAQWKDLPPGEKQAWLLDQMLLAGLVATGERLASGVTISQLSLSPAP